MKIIDCFTFYNELDMLELRLQLLSPVVDFFVLCEATHTFRGLPKPLFFEENKDRFAKYAAQIVHIVDDGLTPEHSITSSSMVWDNEAHQRNHLKEGLLKLDLQDGDYIIVSDVDELVNPDCLFKMKENPQTTPEFMTLVMDMYYYNLETKHAEFWSPVKMIQWKAFQEVFLGCALWVRNTFSGNTVPDAGWHLTYFGDVAHIQNKISNFSHQEINTPDINSAESIQEKIKHRQDICGRQTQILHYVPITENDRLHPLIVDFFFSTAGTKHEEDVVPTPPLNQPPFSQNEGCESK